MRKDLRAFSFVCLDFDFSKIKKTVDLKLSRWCNNNNTGIRPTIICASFKIARAWSVNHDVCVTHAVLLYMQRVETQYCLTECSLAPYWPGIKPRVVVYSCSQSLLLLEIYETAESSLIPAPRCVCRNFWLSPIVYNTTSLYLRERIIILYI